MQPDQNVTATIIPSQLSNFVAF